MCSCDFFLSRLQRLLTFCFLPCRLRGQLRLSRAPPPCLRPGRATCSASPCPGGMCSCRAATRFSNTCIASGSLALPRRCFHCNFLPLQFLLAVADRGLSILCAPSPGAKTVLRTLPLSCAQHFQQLLPRTLLLCCSKSCSVCSSIGKPCLSCDDHCSVRPTCTPIR